MYLSNQQLVEGLKAVGVLQTSRISEALLVVDRKDFVKPEYEKYAYQDDALPIGYGQTISQPFTVAFMFELLEPEAGDNILDVGSGSGWTTALLAQIVGEKGRVLGMEIVPTLVEFGQHNLAKYDFEHAEIRGATDDMGFPEEAPYDRILVSAASESVPEELVGQLKMGGVMVIPVQNSIYRVLKTSGEGYNIEKYDGFTFVPLLS